MSEHDPTTLEPPPDPPLTPAASEGRQGVHVDKGDTAWWRLLPAWSWVGVLGLLVVVGALGWWLGSSSAGETVPKRATEAASQAQAAAIWTCSMHPQIRASAPGACPICGMDLIPVTGGGAIKGELAPNEVRLSPRARALAQIRTTPVLPAPGASDAGDLKNLKTLNGRIEAAEDATRTVSAFTGGRVDNLIAKTTGAKLRRGQIIASLYSPEVYAAHRDLLLGLSQLARLGSTGAASFAIEAARAQLEAARQKLRLLGLTPAELARMEQAKDAWTSVPVHSPFAGTVLERLVEQGQYVQTGQALYRVAKLDRVWAQLDAYQADLAGVSVGQPVTLQAGADVFEGDIEFIDPVVDQASGITRVRVEIPQSEGILRPGMVVRAKLGQQEAHASEHLVIPDSAPLITGGLDLVYVEHTTANEDPVYEAREVTLGQKMGGYYTVLRGLKRGERVVTHGAFVLDADLEIRGGRGFMALMQRQEKEVDMIANKPLAAALDRVIDAYLGITASLAGDDLAGVKAHAKEALGSLDAVNKHVKNGEEVRASEAWMRARVRLKAGFDELERTGSLEAARATLPSMTQAVELLLVVFGNPSDEPLRLAYCPMAFENQGEHWFQRGDTVQNAYFGSKMLGCGDIQQTVAPGGHLAPLDGDGERVGGDHEHP